MDESLDKSIEKSPSNNDEQYFSNRFDIRKSVVNSPRNSEQKAPDSDDYYQELENLFKNKEELLTSK